MSTFAGDVYVLHLLFVALQTSKKCPLLGCTLGVLTHTNARDQDWGGEKTLKWVLIYVAKLYFGDYKGQRVTQDAYFLILTDIKQLSSVAFCDTTAGVKASIGRTHKEGWKDEQTDPTVEVLIERWTPSLKIVLSIQTKKNISTIPSSIMKAFQIIQVFFHGENSSHTVIWNCLSEVELIYIVCSNEHLPRGWIVGILSPAEILSHVQGWSWW